MANPKGNPDFGSKYRFDYGRNEPLSKQVSTRIQSETFLQLKSLAEMKNCTVPDFIREAIAEKLARELQEDCA